MTQSFKLNTLILIAIGFFAFMWGNHSVSLYDNSETQYAHTARVMATSGDFGNLYVNNEAWFVHPPLHFWMTAALGKVFGWNEFALRFPEGFFGIAIVLLTYFWGRRLFSDSVGFWAAFMLACSLYIAIICHLAVFETLFNLCIFGTLILFLETFNTLGTIEKEETRQRPGLFLVGAGVLTGLAILTKGPFGLIHPLLAILPFLVIRKRLIFLLNPWLWAGFLVALGIALPWYFWQYSQHGIAFIAVALKDYTWFRVFGVVENQPGPWYFYFPYLLAFFPWIFYIFPTFKRLAKTRFWNQDTPQNNVFLLSLLVIVTTFVFFSVAKTKLPHYIFLIFPFLSLVISATVFADESKPPRPIYAWLNVALVAVLTLATWFIKAPVIVPMHAVLIKTVFILPLIGSLLFAVYMQFKQVSKAMMAYGAFFLAFMAYLFGVILPEYEVYKDSVGIVQSLKPYSRYSFVNYQGYDPSIMFYLNRHIHLPQTVPALDATLKILPEGPIFIMASSDQHLQLLYPKWQLIRKTYHKELFRYAP